MQVHEIKENLLVQRYADIEGVSEKVASFEGRIVVEGASNGSTGYGFVYCPPEGRCRRVRQGPVEPGPYVGLFGLATVIDRFGGTGAEKDRERAEGRLIQAKVGDFLQLPCGTTFKLVVNRFRDLKAEVVGQ